MDWFPFGATLVGTMTRWAHYGQKLEDWVRDMTTDLDNLARHQMTSAGIMMDWELVEPVEGQFDFSRFDPLMDHAAKLGIKVVLWPWEEPAPEWINRDHPDWFYEADDGSRVPFGCWHHPDFRQAVHRFLEQTVRRYRDNPAMLMWNVGIEPLYRVYAYARPITEPGRRQLFCYQPATVEKFRLWLKVRYQNDLARLNSRWISYYRDWNEIEPIRYNPSLLLSARFLDWRLFWLDALAEYQRTKADLVRQLDPAHITTGNSGWSPDMVNAGLDVHRIAAGFDSFGVSRFPIYRHGRSPNWINRIWYIYCLSACHPNKPCYVHELQGGPQVFGTEVGQTPDPGEIAQWCWQTVSLGYKGIWFWAWRPHRAGAEAGGFGLVNLDGTDTPRTPAAGQTSRDLQKIAPLLNRMKPVTPQVGIVVSPANCILSFAADRFTSDPDQHYMHPKCVEGYFQILSRLRIPVHFLTDDHFHRLVDGDLGHLKGLILPYSPIMEDDRIQALDRFARQAKFIWSDPWLSQRTEGNMIRDRIPDDLLARWFGCVQGQVRPIITDNPINRANLWRGNAILGHGKCTVELKDRTPANLVSIVQEITLDPIHGGQILGRFANGAPGLVSKQTGECSAYYCGSYFAAAVRDEVTAEGFEDQQAGDQVQITAEQTRAKGFLDLFQAVLTEQGILPPIEPIGPDRPEIEANLLTGSNEALAFFINHGPNPLAGDWRIRPGFPVDAKTPATNPLNNTDVPVVSRSPDSVVINVNLPRYGVAVIWLKADS